MTFHELFSCNTPSLANNESAKPGPDSLLGLSKNQAMYKTRFLSAPRDDDLADVPGAVTVTPCCSEESSDSTADVSITGEFRNIARDYRIGARIIGAGNYGSVRECVGRAAGGRCAVKSVRKGDPSAACDLEREIKFLRELRHHPGVVRLVDVYEDRDHLHIVTDLCRGGDLYDNIIERLGCYAEDKAARILRQILAAVSCMHERGIVHRDLKPENVMFETRDERSTIKIIDFGLARTHFGNGREPPMTTVVGTTCYIAPEVLQKNYDRACDLWSVGVIAYILLCGYRPFNGATDEEVDDAVRRCRYRFPAGLSGEAEDFTRRLLQKDPRKRMSAEQALNHPWIVKHANADVAMSDEDRQDGSAVEVVFKESSKRDAIMY